MNIKLLLAFSFMVLVAMKILGSALLMYESDAPEQHCRTDIITRDMDCRQ